MTDSTYYANSGAFQRTRLFIDHELVKSHEEFIVHFKQTYSDPYPPAWILSEILPLGGLTNIFANLKDPQVKKRVAQRFGLQLPVFNSWLTIITLTRNRCCHHARVWNKQNSIMPMMPKKTAFPWITLPANSLRIYFNLCIIKYFINVIAPGNDMMQKLDNLLSAFPQIEVVAMGFPQSWETEKLWQVI